MNIRNFLICCSLLFISVPSYAVTYYWKLTGGGSYQQSLTFPDPKSACESPPGSSWGGYRTTDSSGRVYHSCVADNGVRIWDALRYGDACPDPSQTYDPVSGTCDVDCSATEGDLTTSLIDMGPQDTYSNPSGGSVSPVGAVCENQCAYSSTSTASIQCGTLVGTDQDTDNMFCLYAYVGTGDKCNGEAASANPSVDFNDPETPGDEPTPIDPNDPTEAANNCGPRHAWSGSTCTPIFNESENPGSDPGDTGGGDTGGGDTGGGDTGGGDTGGGDTGGGDTGGGDTGGGGGGGNDGGQCSGDECGAQDWYQPGETTIETVMTDFTDRVTASNVVQATDRFFTMNVGGTCPVWTVNAWVFTVVIDQQCSPNVPWSAIRAVVLACAAFVAFRWAFL